VTKLTKVCTKCCVEKGVSDYNKKKSGKYGVATECKSCSVQRATQWQQVNREYRADYHKVYRQVNRDALLEKKKTYYHANKEADRGAKAKRSSAYAKANPHVINAHNAKRKATKLQATPAWVDLEAIKGMYQLATIFNRTGMNLHVDHIIPLQSDLVCGLHCESNMQLMPASDNISKGNRHWPDQWA
jgi:hypothetical protein